MNELRGHFRPEFLNRLDEIIMFKPLTKDNIGNIINLLMNDLNKRLADREITVELSDSARQFIVDHGYDPIYGARPLKRFLQKHVETLSAKLILADEVREGDTILIDDGLIGLEVKKIQKVSGAKADAEGKMPMDIVCTVMNGGMVSNKKGVNVPNVELSMPYISEKESFEAMLLLQKREKLSRLCFVIENTQIIKFLFKRRIFGKSAEV